MKTLARNRLFLNFMLALSLLTLVVGVVMVKHQLDINALKSQWMRYLTSRVSSRTHQAADELRAAGWLSDGSLRGINLRYANLGEADLSGADFSGAYLSETNFMRANLSGVNFEGAAMQRTSLHDTDLRGANLSGADLQNAYFTGANLEGARLDGAIFSQYTILPDYTYWTADTDMARFTDPTHPNFWRSAVGN